MPSEAPIEAPAAGVGPRTADHRPATSAARACTSSRAARSSASCAAPSASRRSSSRDVAGLALGVYVALVLRSVVYGDTIYWSLLWDTGPAEWLPFLAPITVLVFLQAGLYAPRERRAGSGRILAALVLVALIVLAFGLGTDYDFTTTGLIPTAVATSALAIGLPPRRLRLGLARADAARRRPPPPLLVGEGETLTDLERQLRAARGGIGDRGRRRRSRVAPGRSGLGASLERLAGAARARSARTSSCSRRPTSTSRRCSTSSSWRTARRAGEARPDDDRAPRPRGPSTCPGQGVPLFELRPPMLSGLAWATKRAFDLVVALSCIVLVGMPLWLLVAAAIKLDSRGPVLYVDRRDRRRRARVRDAQVPHDGRGRGRAAAGARGRRTRPRGALFKIRDDPRVTRVGRVLRRLSLDELPQLANVLRGEMSLVGPRPLPLRDHAMLEDWHRARSLVLPGMTGLWQISGRSGLEFDDLVRLDFTYIENWSIWSDISIIARTIPAVLRAGAY